LGNVVNRSNFHDQRKGGYDLSTIENLDDIKVDIELQGTKMSRVEQRSMLEQYLGNKQRRWFHFRFAFARKEGQFVKDIFWTLIN